MNPVAAPPHVTLSGDRAGEYVIEEERPDGRLVLAPDPDDPYPKVTWAEVLERSGGRELTPEELEQFMAEHGPYMGAPDGEG
jgi:hypothetical protein